MLIVRSSDLDGDGRVVFVVVFFFFFLCVFFFFFCFCFVFFFFFKQKTAYEIRNCDWSSDVCSSDLRGTTWSKVRSPRAPQYWHLNSSLRNKLKRVKATRF